jgi:hypothetical protein
MMVAKLHLTSLLGAASAALLPSVRLGDLDGVQTYRLVDGRANACYLPGCSTRIVPLEE